MCCVGWRNIKDVDDCKKKKMENKTCVNEMETGAMRNQVGCLFLFSVTRLNTREVFELTFCGHFCGNSNELYLNRSTLTV